MRSVGLLGVIELVMSKKTREAITDENILSQIRKALEDKHLYLFSRWNCLMIVPPLIIDADTLAAGMAIIDEVIEIADRFVLGH